MTHSCLRHRAKWGDAASRLVQIVETMEVFRSLLFTNNVGSRTGANAPNDSSQVADHVGLVWLGGRDSEPFAAVREHVAMLPERRADQP